MSSQNHEESGYGIDLANLLILSLIMWFVLQEKWARVKV